jgi:hypothetical protein
MFFRPNRPPQIRLIVVHRDGLRALPLKHDLPALFVSIFYGTLLRRVASDFNRGCRRAAEIHIPWPKLAKYRSIDYR